MITGDSSVNQDAPIICCTAEILANIALREGAAADLGPVIMDEFHFYADPQRGWAWQVPLLELPQAQFLLMSATLGDVTSFERELTELTGRPTTTVATAERPIPLHYYYVQTPVHETLEELLATKQVPGLRGALQPGGGHRPGAEPDERQHLQPGGEGQRSRS